MTSECFHISEIEEGILQAEYTGKEMGLNDMIQLYDEIEKMGKGKRVALLNIFHAYIPPRKDAIKYVASARPLKLLYASAIVMDSVAMQVVIMLFMNFHPQKIPRKVFNSKRKALEWLRKMRDNCPSPTLPKGKGVEHESPLLRGGFRRGS